jgi:uncharacterized membrane protein
LSLNGQERAGDARFALLATASALLLAIASLLVLPGWLVAPAVGSVAAALFALSLAADDRRVEWSAWAFAMIAVPALLLGSFGLGSGPAGSTEIAHAAGAVVDVDPLRSALRWSLLAAVLGLFAWRARFEEGRLIAQAWVALILYVAIAQLLPLNLLPLLPAVGLLVAGIGSRKLAEGSLMPALSVPLVIAVAWASLPLITWASAALNSIAGVPWFVSQLPNTDQLLLRLAVPGTALAIAASLARIPGHFRGPVVGTACLFVFVAAHSFFKQLLDIDSIERFVALGLVERLAWESLLFVAAAVLWRLARRFVLARPVAIAAFAAAVLHLVWYSLILHNPLWDMQAVGSLPVFNLLVPLYGLALLALWLAVRNEPDLRLDHPRILDIVQMLLIILFGFSQLRQFFHGSLLVEAGIPEMEEILRSVMAILLAIGFLLLGIVRGSKDWRIGSLVLMLAAVAKVFVYDAAGLEGLLRIMSFVALGFSLIGIGWLYSRFLGGEQAFQRA